MTKTELLADVEWRKIDAYGGAYEVSSAGDVRRIGAPKMIAKSLAHGGYVKAQLWHAGRCHQPSVHRLVAAAFIGSVDDMEVNHRNGIKTDNRVQNLDIVTHDQNLVHAYKHLGAPATPIVAINIETGERTRYRSVNKACTEAGFRMSAIFYCLAGVQHKHKGHRFERADHE